MKILDFKLKYSSPIAVALGFFDCVHLGHASLIERMQLDARSRGVESAVLTFKNDAGEYFGAQKQIFTFEERCIALEKLGVDNVVAATFDDDFASLSPTTYLDMLTQNFNIKSVFIGGDYTFGRGGVGNADTLTNYCAQKGISVTVVPFALQDGTKISTSKLKKYVTAGQIDILNGYLAVPYLVCGEVVHGRHVGQKIGFPTANIALADDKLRPRDGIYATTVVIDGKRYFAMTNVGAKPTFNDSAPSFETNIFDFDGDLYGKRLAVTLHARTRDIRRFDSESALVERLRADKEEITALLSKICK